MGNIEAGRSSEVFRMVTEWEKEELGRLTLQKMKSFSQQEQEQGKPAGRMTQQNLVSLKGAHDKTKTGEAQVKMLLERLKMAVSTGIFGLFAPSQQRVKEDRCAVFGHNLPFGTTWKGPHPKCLDCGRAITDPSQLRGAVPMEERNKFKSFMEK